MSQVRNLLLGLVVTTAFLGILEGGLRLAVPAEQLTFSWEAADPLIAIDDHGDLLMPANHSHEQVDRSGRWQIETNSLGLRESHEIPKEKPPGTYRMLGLGDSWMFGWSVTQGEALPDHLEAALPGQLGVASAEVINTGVFGGAAFDMLRRWRQYQDRFDVDAVLLGTPHNMIRQRALSDTRAGWYRSVRGAPFLDLRIYLVLRRLLAPFTRPQYPLSSDARADTLASSVHDLAMITKDAQERGLDVWFVLMPTRLDESIAERQVARGMWVEALAPHGVKFAGHLLVERSCWGSHDQNHPSPAGYRAMAEVVARAVATGQSAPELATTPSCDDTARSHAATP